MKPHDKVGDELSGLMPRVSTALMHKVNSWCRNGERIPLTMREARRLLKANCIVDANGCWLWQLKQWCNGYGRLPYRVQRAIRSRTGRVHVCAFELWKGEIPSGKLVCHTCDIEHCFNPKHLWLGTNQQNQIDAKNKGGWQAYWTPRRRAAKRKANTGSGNPMYGKLGPLATCYGRVGALHPMFGKHHTEAAKTKIGASLKRAYKRGLR